MNRNVFVVGKAGKDNYLNWELIGIFEDESEALGACSSIYHFIAKVEMNKNFGEETLEFPNAYYPLLEAKEGK